MKKTIAICLLATTGCSFVAQTSPPEYSVHAVVDRESHKAFCSSGFGAPVADTILGTVFLIPSALAGGATISWANSWSYDRLQNELIWGAVSASFLILSGIYWISTIRGFSTARSCRQYLNGDFHW